MRRVVESLRAFRRNNQGSMPLQWALVAALGMGTTVMMTQMVTSKVVDKLNAVTSALTRIRF
jgi:Flp pilus assembly pilin Flp